MPLQLNRVAANEELDRVKEQLQRALDHIRRIAELAREGGNIDILEIIEEQQPPCQT